jgi:hypothetical protein
VVKCRRARLSLIANSLAASLLANSRTMIGTVVSPSALAIRRRLLPDKGVIHRTLTFNSHGTWPSKNSRDFPNPNLDLSWYAIDGALRSGLHGLPGGNSLPKLLTKHRGMQPLFGSSLTEHQILAWADAYFAAHEKWPTANSPGSVSPSVNESWRAIQMALWQGHRGLPGGKTISRLLIKHERKRPYYGRLLSERIILTWADAYFAAHGKWPAQKTPGSVAPSVDDSWNIIDAALNQGLRGLPGGSSLHKLLKKHKRK